MATVPPDLFSNRTFLGRQRELAQLTAAYDAAESGRGSLILLAGEPGIGKSALCEQLVKYVVGSGGLVLAGHCYEERSLSVPYLAFIEALRGFALDLTATELHDGLGGGAAELARIVPEIKNKLGISLSKAGDPEDQRWRLFNAITDFLRGRSAAQPQLLILEDLHWADSGTLEMLQQVARHLGELRLLVIATYRDTEVDRAHPLTSALANLQRTGSVLRIPLRGLDAGEVHLLYEAISASAVPSAQAEVLYRRTEGNPLFVLEILRYFLDEGLGIGEIGNEASPPGPTMESLIPEGLRDVIGRRLNRLSEHANDVLSIAAVIGREFQYDVLHKVSTLPDEDLDTSLGEAVSSALIEERATVGGRVTYRFTHSLIRQTLYEELIAPRRNRWHQEIASAIEEVHAEQVDSHAGELAEHFSHVSAPAELTKSIKYGRLAAENAISVYAYAEAASLLDRCLAVQSVLTPGDPSERCDLLLALGDALIAAGGSARVLADVAPQALALAESMRDEERASQACQQAIHALHASRGWGGWEDPKIAAWAEAADRHAAPGTPARVWASSALGRVKVAKGETEEGVRLLRGALELARNLDSNQCFWVAAMFWFDSLIVPPFAAENLALAKELLSRSKEGVSSLTLRTSLVLMRHPFLHAGKKMETDQTVAQLRSLLDPLRLSHSTIIELGEDALTAIFDGRLRDALEIGERMTAYAAETGLTEYMTGGGFMAGSITASLHLGETEPLAAPTTGQDGERGIPVVGKSLQALVLAATHRHEEAYRLAEELLAQERQVKSLRPVWNDVFRLNAGVSAGHKGLVRLILDRLLPAELPGIERVLAVSVPRLLGDAALLLEDPQVARRCYEQAQRVCEEIGMRPELALADLGLAEVLTRYFPREHAAASQFLDRASRELEALGMRPALERAVALKMVQPRAATPKPDYPAGLSGREVEVLRLVAAGMSNQEIAGELVISLNTVLRHVSNIYAKTGASNRAQATAYALRENLIQIQ